MRARIVLFDIDGTLVDCGGSGRTSMRLAFERFSGEPDVLRDLRFGGMTDRGIVLHGLAKLGLPMDAERIDQVLALYLAILPEVLSQNARYRVIEGALAGVAAAFGAGAAVGLGTGNIKEGARVKLGRADLFDRFPFGGFGCDSEERAELLRAGAERGALSVGRPLAECEVLIVGDTPRDVTAAHAIGARCLAVSTGGHGAAELAEAGADWVVPSLTTDQALAVLRGS